MNILLNATFCLKASQRPKGAIPSMSWDRYQAGHWMLFVSIVVFAVNVSLLVISRFQILECLRIQEYFLKNQLSSFIFIFEWFDESTLRIFLYLGIWPFLYHKLLESFPGFLTVLSSWIFYYKRYVGIIVKKTKEFRQIKEKLGLGVKGSIALLGKTSPQIILNFQQWRPMCLLFSHYFQFLQSEAT